METERAGILLLAQERLEGALALRRAIEHDGEVRELEAWVDLAQVVLGARPVRVGVRKSRGRLGTERNH